VSDGKRIGEAIIGVVWDFRHAFLLLCAVLCVLAGWAATSVGVDNAVEIWFVDDDPALVAYQEFQDTFGNDEVVVLAFEDPSGILDDQGIALLRAAGEAAVAVDGIAEVVSLATVQDIRAENDWLEVGPLVPDGPVTDALARRILADPLLVGKLVNSDGTVALIFTRMEAMGDIDARRDAILAELWTAVDTVSTDYRAAGIGVIYAALNQLSTVDSAVFIVASYGLIVVLLGLFFRRLGPLVITMVAVGVAAIWLMGVYGAAGRNINMVTMVMPTLVLLIAISDCVHILVHVARQPKVAGESRRDRVVRGVGFMFWPCLFNTLTTATGFAALATAPMRVVRDLGLFSAVGLVGAFLATIVICTWGLAYERVEPRVIRNGLLQRGVDRLAHIGLSHKETVLALTGVFTLLAALGVSRIEVDTYSIDFLLEDHPVRLASEHIEQTFGPYTPLEFVVEAPGEALSPQVLRAVDAWQEKAQLDARVGWSRSVVGVVKKLEQVLGGGPAQVPEDADRIEQALLMYGSGSDSDLDDLVDGADRLRVTFGITMQSARGIAATVETLVGLAGMPQGVTVTPAGYLPLYTRIMDYIVRSQITSFGLAFGVVFALIAILFRSVRLAALAVPANLLPVLVTLGAMGLLGVRLDVATVTIAAVVMGLVVDDTVQFLYRLRHELRLTPDDPEAGVRAAVGSVGRSLAITTVVLCLGFSVLGLAQIKSVIWFGLLISLAMGTALVADLLVLPALIALLRPRLD
jgi:predicted RND superfamily exporter protein